MAEKVTETAIEKAQPLLSVTDLRLGFVAGTGRTAQVLTAVDGISFDLYPGETFALLGESGCGKSATAQGLMRLLPAAGRYLGGKVELSQSGQDVLTLPDAALRRVRGGQIAMIFQEPATSLNPVMTVGAQIAEVLAIQRGLTGEPARAETVRLLQQVGIADPVSRLDAFPFQFSGGMKQRVMIAMALAGEPKILIADEPTTALDVTVQAQILDLLATLQRQRGMSILLITHDLGVLAKMAHRIGVMYAGELVEVASREAFFSEPLHPYSRALFAAMPEAVARGNLLAALPGQVPCLGQMPVGCRFADRCTEVLPHCREQSPVWQTLHNGTAVRCWAVKASTAKAHEWVPPVSVSLTVQAEPPAPENSPALLSVRDLQVYFPIRRGLLQRVVGHVRAVDGVSLNLRPGKTLALVGESGCGKTTVGKAILQLLKPTAGQVLLNGFDWTQAAEGSLRPQRQQMQMVFQDPFASLNPRMRIGEILLEGPRAQGRFQQGRLKPSEEARPFLDRLLGQVGLDGSAQDRFPHEFSGGQRQRIAIARALAMEPKVIICDEPTSALDVSVQAQILNLLRDLQQRLGIAYLFITHNFGVVNYLADEVAVMYLGRVVEHGPANLVLSQPRHPYTRTLVSAVPSIHAGVSDRPATLPVGDVPSPAAPPSGCHFHPRCAFADEKCRAQRPCLQGSSGTLSYSHMVACFKPLSG